MKGLVKSVSDEKQKKKNMDPRPPRTKPFASALLKHGMYRDSTLHNATRAIKAAKDKLLEHRERRNQSYLDLDLEFDEHVEYCRKIQQRVQQRQRVMAQLAVEIYSTVCLQTAFRCYSARSKLQILRKVRLLCHWARYCIYWRLPRRRASALIVRNVKSYRSMSIMQVILKINFKVTKLQRFCRKRMACKVAYIEYIRKREIGLLSKRILKKTILFGTTRAARKIKRIELEKRNQDLLKLNKVQIILRFFRSILSSRKIQILTCALFVKEIKSLRDQGLRVAESVILAKEGESTQKSQKIIKDQDLEYDGAHKKLEKWRSDVEPVLARSTFIPHMEIIFYILSRISPSSHPDDHNPNSNTTKVFDYLCRCKIEQEEIERMGAAKVAAEALLNGQANPNKPNSKHVGNSIPKNTIQGVVRRNKTDNKNNAISTANTKVVIGAGQNLKHAPDQVKIRNTVSREVNKSRLIKCPSTYGQKEIIDAGIKEGDEEIDIPYEEPDNTNGSVLPLPKEWNHDIYRPRSIPEIVWLVSALKNMVLSMDSTMFHRILHTHRSIDTQVEIRRDITFHFKKEMSNEVKTKPSNKHPKALLRPKEYNSNKSYGELGKPMTSDVLAYLSLVKDSKLSTTSWSRLIDLREREKQERENSALLEAMIPKKTKPRFRQKMRQERWELDNKLFTYGEKGSKSFYSKPKLNMTLSQTSFDDSDFSDQGSDDQVHKPQPPIQLSKSKNTITPRKTKNSSKKLLGVSSSKKIVPVKKKPNSAKIEKCTTSTIDNNNTADKKVLKSVALLIAQTVVSAVTAVAIAGRAIADIKITSATEKNVNNESVSSMLKRRSSGPSISLKFVESPKPVSVNSAFVKPIMSKKLNASKNREKSCQVPKYNPCSTHDKAKINSRKGDVVDVKHSVENSANDAEQSIESTDLEIFPLTSISITKVPPVNNKRVELNSESKRTDDVDRIIDIAARVRPNSIIYEDSQDFRQKLHSHVQGEESSFQPSSRNRNHVTNHENFSFQEAHQAKYGRHEKMDYHHENHSPNSKARRQEENGLKHFYPEDQNSHFYGNHYTSDFTRSLMIHLEHIQDQEDE